MAVWRRHHFVWIGKVDANPLKRLRAKVRLCRVKMFIARKLTHPAQIRNREMCENSEL